MRGPFVPAGEGDPCDNRSMSDPRIAPPGWYDDGRGERRYWDGTQWTEHTAPLAAPADQTATVPYGTAPLGGADGAGTDASADTTPYASAPAGVTTAGTPGRPPEPDKVNVLGVVALVGAAVGFVLACIPFVQVVAFIVLPVAFVLSIIALFLEGRKWPAITGLIVSIAGAIVGAVVFAVVTLGVIARVADSPAIQDQIREQFEEQFGTPIPSEGAPDDRGAPTTDGLGFGETMSWSNGVSMSVSEPEPFTPSDLALGADEAANLVFTLTITNDSSENVQPVVLSMLDSGGTEATRILDVGAEGGQVGIPPTTAILPGDSITWREAWSVADPGSLTMRTAPSFTYEDATFTNVR